MTKPTYCNFCEETAVKPSQSCVDCGRPVCLDCTGDVTEDGRVCKPCFEIKETTRALMSNRTRNDVLVFAHIFGDRATIEQMTR